MRVNYKGFILEPTSEQLLKNKNWTISVRIENHKGNHVLSKEYLADNSLDSKEKAEEYSREFGKQIINCMHKELSISELL